MEKLRCSERPQDSHDDVSSVAKERESQQLLQEVVQSESYQLKENREIMAKVSFILFPIYVVKHLETIEELKLARCHLEEQEETIEKLRREKLNCRAFRRNQKQPMMHYRRREIGGKKQWENTRGRDQTELQRLPLTY
ncbi:hypothetical protein HPG69_005629 [Diceros bicornis minor]|uniref:Uncharacterized protein n=1 Tax=Diceros bicornis minor TaxID=77932 RepID=A0A7J7E9E8_DICBM|nr:hypothetical protein HPG69_005629 [Diceros bicornis minor]